MSPSKQQQQQQQLGSQARQAPSAAKLHAHTISRATNLQYLTQQQQHYPVKQYTNYNTNYHHNPATTNQHHYQYIKSSQQQQQILFKPPNGPPALLSPAAASATFLPAASYYEPPELIGPHSTAAQDKSEKQQQQQQASIMVHRQLHESLMGSIERQSQLLNRPLCRCRVMYLGSSVPHITKNGLHGIQEPLRHLYPEEQFKSNSGNSAGASSNSSSSSSGASDPAKPAPSGQQATPPMGPNTIDISHLSSGLGIDSWLSVWSNGLLLENFDEFGREVKRFFSIESLHYCAAVRFFDTKTLLPPGQRSAGPPNGISATDPNNNSIHTAHSVNGTETDTTTELNTIAGADRHLNQKKPPKSMVRFLPLDAPLFQCPGMVDAAHPPVFAAILRRTTGIKVLECHAFICRRDAASNALVRCCTQAYADLLAAKRLSFELSRVNGAGALYTPAAANEYATTQRRHHRSGARSHLGTGSRLSGSRTSQPGYSSKPSSLLWGGQHYEPSLTLQASINRRRPAASDSTPNAADASNEDNSIEGSSEDNYAIISKHHYSHQPVSAQVDAPRQQRSTSKTRPLDRQSRGGRKTSQDRNGSGRRTSKGGPAGSSRSLFPDFMPKFSSSSVDQEHSSRSKRQSAGSNQVVRELEKLSHSLDVLELGGGATCCEPRDTKGSIKYSLVGRGHKHGNKRHSRSMQNLDGPFEFTALVAGTGRGSSSSSSRRRHRKSATGRVAGDRRSASYHDISGELLALQSRPQLQSNHSSIGSGLHRMHQQQQHSSSQPSLMLNPDEQLSELPPPPPLSLNPPPLPVIKAPASKLGAYDEPNGESQRIYGELHGHSDGSSTTRRSRKQQQRHFHDEQSLRHQPAVAGPDSHEPLDSGSRRASKFSVPRRRDRSGQRRDPGDLSAMEPALHPPSGGGLLHGQQPPQPLTAAAAYGHSPYTTGAPLQAPFYHHHHHLAAAPGPLYLPYYLPAAAAYSQHHPAQFPLAAYPAPHQQQPIYGSLYNEPAYGPVQHQQLLAQQQHYGPMSGSVARRKSSSQTRSAAKLVSSGFRCLSPPMNFLSTLRRQSTTSESLQQQQRGANQGGGLAKAAAAQSADQSGATNQQPAAAEVAAGAEINGGGSRDSVELPQSPSAIVSARPGFMLSSGARDKKMSWIKRLSLTMGGGGGSASNSPDPASGAGSVPSSPPNPAAEEHRPKKRSSGLFSGSLTIGRRSRQAQRQANGAQAKMVAI